MGRIFAIGDIHGCCNTFKVLLRDKIRIQKEDSIYCVGDYIDRGPDSKGVIDHILQLKEDGYQVYTLRGNHEQMILDAPGDDFSLQMWLNNGGKQTLKSFGVHHVEEIPSLYVSFFSKTELFIHTGDHIFVHAGLNFQHTDIFQDQHAMLWIRTYNDHQPLLQNMILIHGHTPQTLEYILAQNGNCINIDGGCVYNGDGVYGNLVALNVMEKKFVWVENCD